jgi:hypothetical protein
MPLVWKFQGADGENWTHDLLLTMELLYLWATSALLRSVLQQSFNVQKFKEPFNFVQGTSPSQFTLSLSKCGGGRIRTYVGRTADRFRIISGFPEVRTISLSRWDTPVSSLYGALRLRSGQAPNKEKGSHGVRMAMRFSIHRYPGEFILELPRKAAFWQSVVIDHSTTPPFYKVLTILYMSDRIFSNSRLSL